MDMVSFGRTGLQVSVAGLGCGGNSRLGLGQGKTEADAVRLIRAAHDLGVMGDRKESVIPDDC